MAARWLGGEPPAALTGDGALLDMIMQPRPSIEPGFRVSRMSSRRSEASASALMFRETDITPEPNGSVSCLTPAVRED